MRPPVRSGSLYLVSLVLPSRDGMRNDRPKTGQVANRRLPTWPMRHRTGSVTIASEVVCFRRVWLRVSQGLKWIKSQCVGERKA
jgi:hypothetical protein